MFGSVKDPVLLPRLRELLSYDPESGVFHWLADMSPRVKAGAVAGCLTAEGYIGICVDRVQYLAHRLAWFHFYGTWPVDQIDHQDLNKSNNRISNLRAATGFENAANKLPSKLNKCGIRGVWFNKRNGLWGAEVWKDGRRVVRRFFKSIDQAKSFRLAKSDEIHGQFAPRA